MRLIYSKWTFGELGSPMEGREGGHPIQMASYRLCDYDTESQLCIDLDHFINTELCADILRRTGAYFISSEGKLKYDSSWTPGV